MYFHIRKPHTCEKIDEPALAAWQRDGVLKMTGVLSAEWVSYVRSRLREKLGAEPEDPSCWENVKSSVLKPLGRDARCVSIDAEPVRQAVNALIGEGWNRPKSGGSWFCNKPTQVDVEQVPPVQRVPRGNWHWDNRPDLYEPGLWVFTPLVDLVADFGGTWMVAGSHGVVGDFYDGLPPADRGKPTKQVKKWFTKAHPWMGALNGNAALELVDTEGNAVPLINVSGVLGDVVFMKDFMVHSIPAIVGPSPRVCHVITASSDL